MIHFWDLPNDRIHIKLKGGLSERMVEELLRRTGTIRDAGKMTGFSENTIKRMRKSDYKIKIKTVLQVSKLLAKNEFSPLTLEKSITWIGHPMNDGIENPRIPFNFSSRCGARFVAAIFNDGTISRHYGGIGRMMYDNFNERLRESVKSDIIHVTGGKSGTLKDVITMHKKYVAFPSVYRDILMKILEPGPKTETNQALPQFILEKKSCMLGWLEQTIADEGDVKYHPQKYRRSIVWRRSDDITDIAKGRVTHDMPLRKMPKELRSIVGICECRMIIDELRLLEKLGISYDLYNLGVYMTVHGKVRTRWQIGITKRENLIRLRKMIKIPHREKDMRFSLMMRGFVRYKEPLRPRKVVQILGREGRMITSGALEKKMGYKNIGTANKWLHILEREGIIRKVKESSYDGGYRKPAHYVLTLGR